jgi:hypothetical protein
VPLLGDSFGLFYLNKSELNEKYVCKGNNWEIVYILIIIREPKTQVLPWPKTITILNGEALIILFYLFIYLLLFHEEEKISFHAEIFGRIFFGKKVLNVFFSSKNFFTKYIKSIFY